jgi:hypothetical protein
MTSIDKKSNNYFGSYEDEDDAFSLFLIGIRSPVTRERYVRRLGYFFNYLASIEKTGGGATAYSSIDHSNSDTLRESGVLRKVKREQQQLISFESSPIPLSSPCFASNRSMEDRCNFFVLRAKKDNQWVYTSVLKFLLYLKGRVDKKEISASTLRNYSKPIKLFLYMNDIQTSSWWNKVTRGLPSGRKWANDRAPTIDEIRTLVQYPDRRIKPIVYVAISSGIRLAAWDYLKWGHIRPIRKIRSENDVYDDRGGGGEDKQTTTTAAIREGEGGDTTIVAAKMIVYAGEEEQYTTFITPAAYKALKDWMDYRQRSGETITEESWVMRQVWDSRVAKGRGIISLPRKLKHTGIKAIIDSALWTQGLRTKLPEGKKRHEFQLDHGFRKFFKTHAEQVMRPINVEVLMGHSIGISDSYYRPTEGQLLRDYLKAVDLLTIKDRDYEMVKSRRSSSSSCSVDYHYNDDDDNIGGNSITSSVINDHAYTSTSMRLPNLELQQQQLEEMLRKQREEWIQIKEEMIQEIYQRLTKAASADKSQAHNDDNNNEQASKL